MDHRRNILAHERPSGRRTAPPLTPPQRGWKQPRAGVRSGFSLVELLVVVTVIVVLLALLTPALDQAVYQAELATCSARLHALGTSVVFYAMENRRKYPPRPILAVGQQPVVLKFAEEADDRVNMNPYIRNWALVVCPLAGNVKVGPADTHPNSTVMSPYALWFGWKYSGNHNRGMLRLGDRFSFDEVPTDDVPAQVFEWLATDWDFIDDTTPRAINTHPDSDGVLANYVVQDTEFDYYTGETSDPTVITDVTGGRITLARWQARTRARGTTEMNCLGQDLAVKRLDRIAHREGEPGNDERIVRVPFQAFRTSQWPQWKIHLPKR
jgi:prepilin-type N-terminal cleavage/methylation domain-containing protein